MYPSCSSPGGCADVQYGLVKRGTKRIRRSTLRWVAESAQFGMRQLHGAIDLLHVVGTVVSGEVAGLGDERKGFKHQ
jgi:hypothetical protein